VFYCNLFECLAAGIAGRKAWIGRLPAHMAAICSVKCYEQLF